MSTIKPKSYIEIALSSIKIFGNDGTIDLAELNFMLGLALRDQMIDEDEKAVLSSIFAKAAKGKLSAKVSERIAQVKAQHGIE
jgi:hypothetical protein